MSATTPYLLIQGASVWSPDHRFGPASVLVAGGRIVEVGSPGAMRAPAGARVVRARGQFLIPGFVDAHTHLIALALQALRCDLSPARSAGDAVALLEQYASSHEHDVIVGVDWDESTWPDAAFPTREALDAAFPDTPVYARRVCGHVGVVNDAFMKRFATIAARRGDVDSDAGIMVEEAVFAANRATRPRGAPIVSGMARAVARLHALGITAVHDIVESDGLDDYAAGLAKSAPLHVDALLTCPVDAVSDISDRIAATGPDTLRVAGVKRFMDGSFGARTAALHEPYADADTAGSLLLDEASLAADLEACAAAGVVCAVHAIGDRATDTVVSLMRPFTGRDARLRIEHAELVSATALDTIASTAIPLVVQPNFARNWAGDGGLYERRLGKTRLARTNAFRTLVMRGIPVVFSSDGMPPGPLFGLRGATHHPVAGERIDAARALACYTESAHSMPGHARDAGRIAPGQAADLVLVSGNPLLADLDRLSVVATIVSGTVVFGGDAENA